MLAKLIQVAYWPCKPAHTLPAACLFEVERCVCPFSQHAVTDAAVKHFLLELAPALVFGCFSHVGTATDESIRHASVSMWGNQVNGKGTFTRFTTIHCSNVNAGGFTAPGTVLICTARPINGARTLQAYESFKQVAILNATTHLVTVNRRFYTQESSLLTSSLGRWCVHQHSHQTHQCRKENPPGLLEASSTLYSHAIHPKLTPQAGCGCA